MFKIQCIYSVWTFQKLQIQTLLNNLIVSDIRDIMVNIDTKGTTTKNCLKNLIRNK